MCPHIDQGIVVQLHQKVTLPLSFERVQLAPFLAQREIILYPLGVLRPYGHGAGPDLFLELTQQSFLRGLIRIDPPLGELPAAPDTGTTRDHKMARPLVLGREDDRSDIGTITVVLLHALLAFADPAPVFQRSALGYFW